MRSHFGIHSLSRIHLETPPVHQNVGASFRDATPILRHGLDNALIVATYFNSSRAALFSESQDPTVLTWGCHTTHMRIVRTEAPQREVTVEKA